MSWYRVKDQAKITAIVRHLVSHHREIEIHIDGEKEAFRSRVLKVNRILSENGEERQIMIQRLVPPEGNELIRSSSEVRLDFMVREKICRCKTKCVGSFIEGANLIFLLAFPASIEVHKKRHEERAKLDILEALSAELRVGGEAGGGKVYDLNVVDRSRRGLGLLVTRKDFELLKKLNVGDPIRDIVLYTPWAVLKVDGKVVHKKELRDGDHKGSSILGVKSRDLIN